MNEEQIRQIAREVAELVLKEKSHPAHQSDFLPNTIKQRHIDGMIIKRGLAANRPVDGGVVNIMAYFSTDTDTLNIWNGTAWVQEIFT